jgi:hypothetical protein
LSDEIVIILDPHIAELHGEEKMNAAEFKDVWPELATKMKST